MPPHRPDDPSPTAAQERAVRDLLASARHDEPVPDDVAARLDARLAELTAVRREVRPQVAPVVPLAAGRRRLATGLVAAAAVVVTGVGLGQLLPETYVASQDALSSEEAGGVDEAGAADEAPETGATWSRKGRDRATADQRAELADKAERSPAATAPPSVDPDDPADLERAARRVRDQGMSLSAQQGYRGGDAILGSSGVCLADPSGRGRRVLVDYGGTPALLVLSRAGGDTRLVRVLSCDSGELLRSTRIPVR